MTASAAPRPADADEDGGRGGVKFGDVPLDHDGGVDEDADEGRAAGGGGRGGGARDAEDAAAGDAEDPFKGATGGSGLANTRIADRETAYHARRHDREVREDGTSYKEAMEAANQERERRELIEELRQGDDGKAAGGESE